MTAPARFTKDDLKRAFTAAKEADFRVGEVVIFPDGRIVIRSESAAPASLTGGNPWDVELQ